MPVSFDRPQSVKLIMVELLYRSTVRLYGGLGSRQPSLTFVSGTERNLASKYWAGGRFIELVPQPGVS